MVIRTKVTQEAEKDQQFEDVITQPNRIETFTIPQVEKDIANKEAQIVRIQAEIAVLVKRKDDAEKL